MEKYRVTIDNKELRSRIYNFKFKSALQYLRDESKEVQELVNALASMLGNCGWIEGSMGTLASASVELLIGDEFEA